MIPFARSASWYDLIYAAKGKDYAGEARILASLAAEARRGRRAGRLLDVACGTGEHLRFLRASFDVRGLDASPAMLAVARAKLPAVRFDLEDMTRFDLGERFDVVTCLFASIGYLPDEDALRAAIDAMAGHLAPGGVLLLEPALPPDRLEPARRSSVTVTSGGRTLTRVTTAEHLPGALAITFEHRLAGAGGDDGERFTERHVIRLVPPAVHLDALRAAGLDVDGSGPWSGPAGLLVARRP